MKKFLCVFLAMFTLTLSACGGKAVYRGEGYEFEYDTAKWNLNFEAGGTVSLGYEDSDEVSLGIYRYVPEGNVTLAERLERSEEICGSNGFVWDGGEVLLIGGSEWCRAEYRDEKFKYVNFLTEKGGYAYAVTFTSDIGSYDKCVKEFETVFDSFVITE